MNAPKHFRDRSVILTGASSGLGATLAEELGRAGAQLTLFARDAAALEAVAERVRRAGGQAIAVPGDVTRAEDCQGLVEKAVAAWGGVDDLVANAGLSMWTPFEAVEDVSIFQRLIEVNYLGPVYCIRATLPRLRERRGLIVAVTSIQAKIAVPMHTGYAASKHALQGFCDALRMELDGSGVDVLTVLPSWIAGTEMRRKALGGDGQELGESSRKHSRHAVSVEESARAILQAMAERRRELIIPWKIGLLLALKRVSASLAERIISSALRSQKA